MTKFRAFGVRFPDIVGLPMIETDCVIFELSSTTELRVPREK
jgi:hypothetical protein